jgi:2'-5' RNA ligase
MPRENNSSFQRFAVVSFPDRASVQRIEELRAELPPRIAVMAPHVTLKGSFIGPTSIDEIQQEIGKIACESSPLRIEVKSIHIGEIHIGLDLIPTTDLISLHDQLFYALQLLVTDVYHDRPGSDYHPHMTVFYGLSENELNRAKRLVQDLEDLSSFTLTEASLVGRMGSAETGQWQTIQSFPLGEQV